MRLNLDKIVAIAFLLLTSGNHELLGDKLQPNQGLSRPNSIMKPPESAQQLPTQASAPKPVPDSANTKPLVQMPLPNAAIATPSNAGNIKLASADRPAIDQIGKPSKSAFSVAPKLLTEIGLTNYGNDDPIVYLDYSTMNDEILHRRTANFVYFNANFNHCRHCQKFFNIWKDLAVDIRWWRQVIRLHTINCSEEDNIDLCRRAGITQFPQVRYYWIMSNSLERDGQRLRILGKSVHAMRHLIMDKILDSYAEQNKLQKSQQQLQQQKRVPSAGVGPMANALVAGQSQSTGLSASTISSLLSNPLIGQLVASNGGLPGIMSTVSSGRAGPLGGLVSSLGGVQGIGLLLNGLLAANPSSPRSSGQPMPSNWPELEPIEVANTHQLVDMLPLNPTKGIGALLIMETQEFLYTGLETMLDLSPYGNQTYIARVRDERSQLSKNLTKRDDIQAPALIYVTANREVRLITTAPKYTNDEDLRRAFVRAFERRQIKYPVKRIWSIAAANKNALSSESQEDEEILAKVNQVFMNDLTNAVRSSLMEQVFRHPDLSDDQYNALVKYVYALINYFPFNNDESLKFFKRLHSWLQNQVSPMDIAEYKKQFHDIDEVFPRRDWIACKSLSNTKAIPSKGGRRAGSVFENPAQIGKVVSNITRLFRGQQQQTSKLKSFLNVLTNNASPVMPSSTHQKGQVAANSTGSTAAPLVSSRVANEDDSPIERIIKSLTSGSLGSDSSILKLISTALTGGTNGDPAGSTGKSKFAREFPCGIWKLAHVLVVNEYIKDSPRKDVKHIVLHSLYQYMLHFYACSTCGNRVSDVSGEFRINLDENLQDQADSILLLWKVHNRVNKRLESELRPGLPLKVQFPSEILCPKCRESRAHKDLVSTPNWHEKQVLNFLVHHYRPQSLIINTNSAHDTSSARSYINHLNGMAYIFCLMSVNLFIHLYKLH